MTAPTLRKVQFGALLLGLGVAVIGILLGMLWFADFLIGPTAAPGVQDRWTPMLICLLTLLQFSPARRERTPRRLLAETLLPFVAVMSVLWFLHTGNAKPFGYPAVFAYLIAWIVVEAVGFALGRIPAVRRRVMA